MLRGCSRNRTEATVHSRRWLRRLHRIRALLEGETMFALNRVWSWQASVGYGGARAFLGAQTESSTTTNLVGHFAVALQSATVMPPPHRSAHGAVAKIGTSGNHMFSGSATFVSHRRPSVSRVRVRSGGTAPLRRNALPRHAEPGRRCPADGDVRHRRLRARARIGAAGDPQLPEVKRRP